jgi:hypothetical protein
MANKYMKKMFNIPVHKRNANQNNIDFSLYTNWNSYHQNHKQLQKLARIFGGDGWKR